MYKLTKANNNKRPICRANSRRLRQRCRCGSSRESAREWTLYNGDIAAQLRCVAEFNCLHLFRSKLSRQKIKWETHF